MPTQVILTKPAHAGMFLVLTVREGGEETARTLLNDVSGLTRSVAFRQPDSDLTCVVGIGATFWDRAYDAPRPKHLHPFAEIVGERYTAVSTPGELLVHIRAKNMALCFELGRLIVHRLTDCASVVDEVHGFKYFDERDLLGFVDGTENPEGDEAVRAVRITEDDDAAYAGGSYVIVQKYLHDLAAWNALTVEQQEAAIGRSKLEDVEFADEDKLPNSHLALNVIEDADGNELSIVRQNMPFGSVGDGEFGTYFIGYAADPSVIERMLRNMFVGNPPGTHDRLLDFSKVVTGSLYFVPTVEMLDDGPD